jgi:hypothetical protein
MNIQKSLRACLIALIPLLPNSVKSAEQPRFELIQTHLTWHAAKAAAEARGGHLATFTSEAEFNAFQLLVKPKWNCWVGGYQPEGSAEPSGGWRWITGEEWTFSNWMPGAPENTIGRFGREDFLISEAVPPHASGKWNDGGLEYPTYYIVEYEVSNSATAVAQLVNGFVVGVTLVNPGFGYKSTPTIQISGGGGSGAVAEAKMSNGIITEVVIKNPGIGYTSLPDVIIDAVDQPPHELSIRVSRISLNMKVSVGKRYQLQSSENLTDWGVLGDPFVAQSPELSQEFTVSDKPTYYRLIQMPN